MHLHVRIHHWVLWWFYTGVIIGVIAVVNILTRDLTRAQERVILIIGLLFWTLGGIVCHAYEGIKFERPRESPGRSSPKEPEARKREEWHPASDFVFPGHKRLLPPK
jgi:hypothetical protein